MPHFIFCAWDRPDASETRNKARESHRVYIRQPTAHCRCVAGGPLMDETDTRMVGTLLIFEAETRDDVARFMADDPYSRSGLFARIEIWNWRWGLGQPSSGKNSSTS